MINENPEVTVAKKVVVEVRVKKPVKKTAATKAKVIAREKREAQAAKAAQKKAQDRKNLQERKEKLGVVNVKMTAKERAGLMRNAKLHTEGNLSAWLRRAGLEHAPKVSRK